MALSLTRLHSTAGIAMATAKYVVLVNSDAFVGRGWLYSLWDTFRTRPAVGMVGPLMIGEGGLVTEAGGIIWKDAGAANYARGRSHQAREVGHPPLVHCLAAALRSMYQPLACSCCSYRSALSRLCSYSARLSRSGLSLSQLRRTCSGAASKLYYIQADVLAIVICCTYPATQTLNGHTVYSDSPTGHLCPQG
jgi:hypothetical protein